MHSIKLLIQYYLYVSNLEQIAHLILDSEGGNREEAVYEEIQMTVNPGYEQIMFSSPQYDNL